MTLLEIDPKTLKPAAYNPASRTDDRLLKALEEDIAENGILMPLVATERNELIDGHRRLKVALKQGMATVPVLVSPLGQEDGFRRLNDNATRKPIKGRDWLCVYVAGGTPPEPYLGQCRELEAVLGKKRLAEVAEKRTALHVLAVAKQVAAHCEDRSRTFVRSLVMWMVRHRMQLMARRAVVHGAAAEVIIRAVEEDRPLRWTIDLG